MPHLVFKLRAVPDDEANEIRELLQENNIDFYETQAGNWGISLAAIWASDNEESTKAKQLIEEYQVKRFQRQRAQYQMLVSQGEQKTLCDIIKRSPVQFIAIIFAILLILYISIMPFITM